MTDLKKLADNFNEAVMNLFQKVNSDIKNIKEAAWNKKVNKLKKG